MQETRVNLYQSYYTNSCYNYNEASLPAIVAHFNQI